MPYLQVELDAVNLAPDLGRGAGIHEDAALAGLVRMWAWCFRTHGDQVSAAQLAGFFGGDSVRVGLTLVAFGFLEARGDGWRVRGADRYLRLHEARRKGGLAARKNLVPGAKQKRKSLGYSREPAELQPGSSTSSPGLLHQSPTTNHQEEKKAPATPSPAKKPPSDFYRAQEMLVAAYAEVCGSKYKWQGAKDSEALKRLVAVASPEEIASRFRVGLKQPASAWLYAPTVAQLDSKWNDLTAAKVGTTTPERKVTVL